MRELGVFEVREMRIMRELGFDYNWAQVKNMAQYNKTIHLPPNDTYELINIQFN